jgi:hypothetical protein
MLQENNGQIFFNRNLQDGATQLTESEINDYELARAKIAKCLEICAIRDQKILEDSLRHSEAQTGESEVMALTTIEDIEAYDINSPFS